MAEEQPKLTAKIKATLGGAVQPIAAVLLGLMIGASLTVFAGENPFNVLRIIFTSAFGSRYDLGMTLFYATPLMFTGLSVAAAFHAGLFNIGAEGQLTLGALAAAVVGILFPEVVFPWGVLLSVIAAICVGGLWGALPGWLKAYRGSHEVITTIMLNAVAAGLASWITLYFFRNTESQNPETMNVGPGFMLSKSAFFEGAPLTAAILIAVASSAALSFFLWRTRPGYELRAVGTSEPASATAGISVRKVQIGAMALAGALAGLAGIGDVLGSSGKFKMGFSADYGFVGIAVALLARSNPIAIIFSAFLFAALHKGAADLDFETENVTRDLSVVLQACVILTVCADGFWEMLKRK